MNEQSLDRLVILIISESQADRLMKHFRKEDFRFTVINSSGEVGQEATLCLLIGFFHERMQLLLEIVRKECGPYKKFIPTQGILPAEAGSLPLLEVKTGGALVYTMNVVRYEQL